MQGDLFSGLNDGLISRAEALAAVDIKHQGGGGPAGLPQLKHDMMYHHGMGAPPPVSRPQVKSIAALKWHKISGCVFPPLLFMSEFVSPPNYRVLRVARARNGGPYVIAFRFRPPILEGALN